MSGNKNHWGQEEEEEEELKCDKESIRGDRGENRCWGQLSNVQCC